MYRRPTREESTTLRRAFHWWGIFEFLQDKPLSIKDQINDSAKQVYLLTPEVEGISLGRVLAHAGLMIGILRKKLMLSMAGADLVARESKKFPHVVVDDDAEKAILYGKNILGESIVENTEIIVENQHLIILNLHREAIGIGMTKYHGKYLSQRGIATVTTLIDAGIYLRNEQRRRGNL